MTNDKPLSYRADIDGLRAIAVLVVLGYHAYPNVVTGGFIGVDIFFVISGFLISSIIFQALDRNNFSFTDFYSRRIRRIFPALIVVLCACLALGWFLLLTDEYIQLGKHTTASAAFGPNFVLMKGFGYFDSAAELKPLLHLWSLGIEEQFYIVWPLLLVLIWRRVPSVFWVLVSITIMSFTLNVFLANLKPIHNFYLPITRCWELLIGSTLAHVSLYKTVQWDGQLGKLITKVPSTAWLQNLENSVGAMLIVLALALINKDSLFPGWWALMPTIGTFLIIAAGPNAWLNRNILAHPALVSVGLISYPLYLWHWPLLSFTQIMTDGNAGAAQNTLVLLLSFGLSWLTYRFWETPLRKNKSAWIVVILVSSIALVGFSGELIRKAKGLPSRYPKNIQPIANFSNSFSLAKSYRQNSCFINPKKPGSIIFSEECLEPARSEAKKIFLWGDSHAAHLYPGLHHFEDETRFRVIQMTSGGCPPILNAHVERRPFCQETNQKILETITETAPDLVVMAGNWAADPTAWRQYADLDKLAKTIDVLQTLGFPKIILVGSVPAWLGSAPKALVKFSKLHNWQDPPDRLPRNFAKQSDNLDAKIEAIAKQKGVSFVSPRHTFCNSEGCLAKIDGVPTAFDCCHLTESGSRYLIESNLPTILQLLQLPAK